MIKLTLYNGDGLYIWPYHVVSVVQRPRTPMQDRHSKVFCRDGKEHQVREDAAYIQTLVVKWLNDNPAPRHSALIAGDCYAG